MYNSLCYRLSLSQVLVELFIRAVCCHSLRKNVQLRVRQEGFYIRKGVANACDRSLRQEFEHFLRGFTESLEQGLLKRPPPSGKT
jgi:hypothetical protein